MTRGKHNNAALHRKPLLWSVVMAHKAFERGFVSAGGARVCGVTLRQLRASFCILTEMSPFTSNSLTQAWVREEKHIWIQTRVRTSYKRAVRPFSAHMSPRRSSSALQEAHRRRDNQLMFPRRTVASASASGLTTGPLAPPPPGFERPSPGPPAAPGFAAARLRLE